jgi:acyl-CoA reductase-like NAD-dependent aldehyde dehydrogenase
MTTRPLAGTDTDYVSQNPATGQVLEYFPLHAGQAVDALLGESCAAGTRLGRLPAEGRAAMLERLAAHFEIHAEAYAALITREMGKPVAEARQEIAKCAATCRTLAESGPAWLSPVPVKTEAASSQIRFQSLGPVLAIMPWNFPFFQAVRFLAPAIMAGNTIVLKHAENVPACALALESAVTDACGQPGILVNLRVRREEIPRVIGDPRIRAVTLTGSVAAGRAVAAQAGSAGKKVVLELGGSDPFIVLADADLDAVIPAAVEARFWNCGQSCICGKRFVVASTLLDQFLDGFAAATRQLRVGDPMEPATSIGPMARLDLRAALDRQVRQSVARGARTVLAGGPRPGAGNYFEPVILTGISGDSPAACEELFGPAASVFPAGSDAEAVELANATAFGLGCSVWTSDQGRAAQFLDRVEAGMVFVNSVVKSDARLPFGGVKNSGYGRELGVLGIREFTNMKTIWIA